MVILGVVVGDVAQAAPTETAVVYRIQAVQGLPAGFEFLPPADPVPYSWIQEKTDRLYSTGKFRRLTGELQRNPDGSYNLVYQAELNPQVETVQVNGVTLANEALIQKIFQDVPQGVLNNQQLEKSLILLESWYHQQGYTMAQVRSYEVVRGTLVVDFNEGLIEDISFEFVDERGQKKRGRTRPRFLLQQLVMTPGLVYRQDLAERDRVALESLGLFSQVRQELVTKPGGGYLLRYRLQEARSRNLNAGVASTGRDGVALTIEYSDRNVAGEGQVLELGVTVGSSQDIVGSARYFHPLPGGRMALDVDLAYGYSLPSALDGQVQFLERRIELGMPMLFPGNWRLRPFIRLQNIRAETPAASDVLGNRLTATGALEETLGIMGVELARDQRDSRFLATRGQLLRVNWQQGLVGSFYGRVTADAAWYFPLPFIQLQKQTAALVLGGSLGLSYGNLPPYEAFVLGGPDSVRGWRTAAIATSRHYGLASLELRLPLAANLYGVAFLDAATAWNSQTPTGLARKKPGSGIGYGLGLRLLNQRLGVDWGFNPQGESQITFSSSFRF